MLRKLGTVVAASVMLLPLSSFRGIASAAPTDSMAHPTGWIHDFCKDSKNWDQVEEWTGKVINSRGACVAALQALTP